MDTPIKIRIDTIVDDRQIRDIGRHLNDEMRKARATLGAGARDIDVGFVTRTLDAQLAIRRQAAAENKSTGSLSTQQHKQDLALLREQLAVVKEQSREVAKRRSSIAMAEVNRNVSAARTAYQGRAAEARNAPMLGPNRQEWARIQAEERKTTAARIAHAKLERDNVQRQATIARTQHNERIREEGYATGKRVVTRTQDDGSKVSMLSDAARPRAMFDARYFQHRFGGQVGQIVTGTLPATLARVVGGIASAAGGRVTPTEALTDAVSLDKEAISLSNAGIIESDPDNAQRVMPSVLKARFRAISDDTGFTAMQVKNAIDAHREIGGSLKGALAAAPEIIRFAAANAADPVATMSLTGSLQSKLEARYGKDKAPALAVSILRSAGQQGRLGAVEIPDITKYGEQVMAMVPQTSQDLPGAFRDAIAMAQLSRSFGGSATGAQALKSQQQWLGRLQTGAGQKKYKALTGKDAVHNDKLDPIQDLVFNLLDAAKGDGTAINTVFPGLIAARGPRGILNPYIDARDEYRKSRPDDAAGAHRAGMEGARRAFDKYDVGQGSDAVAAESLALVQSSTPAQMERLNNAVGSAADVFNGELAGALKDAVPNIKSFASTLGDKAVWALENPKEAAAIAAGGLIGMSAASSGIGAIVTGLVASIGALPVAVGAAVVAALGYGAYNVVTASQARDVLADPKIANVSTSADQIAADEANALTADNPAALQRYLDRAKARKSKIGAEEVVTNDDATSWLPYWMTGEGDGAAGKEQSRSVAQEKDAANNLLIEKLTSMISALTIQVNKGIKVDVTPPVAPTTPQMRGNNNLAPVP